MASRNNNRDMESGVSQASNHSSVRGTMCLITTVDAEGNSARYA